MACISDSMLRMTAAGARLRPMHEGGVLIGPALTVKTRPGDNLVVHKALDLAEPGDVVVVDAGGDLTNAIVGALMVSHAVQRRLAGIVINGAVRDYDTIRAGRFPIYAAGVTHRGPFKDGPGEINVSVAIDGMVIAPGDLVVGDADGLVSIPYDEVETLLKAASAKQAAEERDMRAIVSGISDRKWVDERLVRLGCDLQARPADRNASQRS